MTGKKILVVDADAASRNFITRNLLEKSYEVLQTGLGKEGLIFAWRDHPDIIIIDPVLPDLKGEEIAIKLRQDPRTSNVPLIALSSDTSPARVKSCMEAGFLEYIIKSGQALPVLNETINNLLGVSAIASRTGGCLIVFLSAKGGTGTSSLCANYAHTIATNLPEADIVTVDLVLPLGSLSQIIGQAGEDNIVTISDLKPNEIGGEFFRGRLAPSKEWMFRLLAGSPDPESSNHLKGERIGDIIAALKGSFDYVVVDLGRSLSRISLPLIQSADLVVMIVSTDTGTVTLTKTLWDYLKNKNVDPNVVYPILNRAVGLEGLTKPEVEKMLGLNIKTAIPYLGSNFTLANNQHIPFTTKFPKDTASIIFKDTARDMVTLIKKSRPG